MRGGEGGAAEQPRRFFQATESLANRFCSGTEGQVSKGPRKTRSSSPPGEASFGGGGGGGISKKTTIVWGLGLRFVFGGGGGGGEVRPISLPKPRAGKGSFR